MRSVRFAGVGRRCRVRTGRPRGVGRGAIDLCVHASAARRDALEGERRRTGRLRLLRERVPGSDRAEPRLYGHRPGHGLDVVYIALSARRGAAPAPASRPGLFGLGQAFGRRSVGRGRYQAARGPRLPVRARRRIVREIRRRRGEPLRDLASPTFILPSPRYIF